MAQVQENQRYSVREDKNKLYYIYDNYKNAVAFHSDTPHKHKAESVCDKLNSAYDLWMQPED